jgi:hypothetical protein
MNATRRFTDRVRHEPGVVGDMMTQIRERLDVPDRAQLAADLVRELADDLDHGEWAQLVSELDAIAEAGIGVNGRGVLREGDEPLV